MERRLVFLRHAGRNGSVLALFLQKTPVEVLFGAGGFRFQSVQHFLVQEGARAFGHGTFIHDVIDPIQDAVGGEFSFRQPIERFHFFGKSFDRCGERGALLFEIVLLPMQHVAEEAGGLVVEIVAGGHHVIVLLDRDPIELVSFDRAAGAAGRTMNDLRQFLDASTFLLLNGVCMERRAQRCPDGLRIPEDFLMRVIGIAGNAEIHVECVRLVSELQKDVPECQTVFSARHSHKNPIFFSKHLLRSDRACRLVMNECGEAPFAECRVMAGESDRGLGFTFCAVHGYRGSYEREKGDCKYEDGKPVLAREGVGALTASRGCEGCRVR